MLIYGYATGCYCSGKIERAADDSLAFRFIAANSHPGHDTLATFRGRFAKELEASFVQVLQVARENQLSRFGTVSLDGTRIHANASRHSALSYGHAAVIAAQLQGEVQPLPALAEEADGANLPEGMSLPEELRCREDRLAAIAHPGSASQRPDHPHRRSIPHHARRRWWLRAVLQRPSGGRYRDHAGAGGAGGQ